jgi:cation-transporting P-type ATPase F
MQTLLGRHWHHLSVDEVLLLLETDSETGLDLFEIGHRQERFGPNRLTPRQRKSPVIRFLQQFNNPLIYILMAAAVITAVVKDVVDAVIIAGVVMVNAIVGFIQESRAEAAIEALAETMTTEATVLRATRKERIPATELVPGDIVSLSAGDKVPADMRLLRSRDLQIAEASLTGESLPVQKAANAGLQPDAPLAERRTMAYASTLVTYGQAIGVVTAIGDDTEIGHISQLIASAENLETPLTRKIGQFSQIILYAILALAAATFAVGVWRGQPFAENMTAAIALAVGMIPEGLPAALTVTLAIGVSRMASRRAIIRKLPAVETLGSVTVICSDKTGTLTQNQMTVRQIALPDAEYETTGTGYTPEGEIRPTSTSSHGPETDTPAVARGLHQCLAAGLLCNDSRLVQRENGQWNAQGDPTEVALIVSAHKYGITESSLNLPRLDAIPFESEHQYMATLHDADPGRPRPIFVKGAVHVILAKCRSAMTAEGDEIPLDPMAINQQADAMASQGLRVLAFAQGAVPTDTTTIGHEDTASGLVFLGLQGMTDPPRPEAIAAVKACQEAGVEVKMITGDHALTAEAIARQLGLRRPSSSEVDPLVMTGQDIADCCDEDLIEQVLTTSVFARVTPEQKLRLVEALQSRNHIVAMTGDGVNDGPALKQADVGVAMGITGTDVAKEAADMVLTDDNFSSIEAAVEEGRGVFDNLTKIITWTLPTNLGEGLIILLAVFAGITLPILPIHILWINMVTVAVLGIVLALEPKEPGIMTRRPRDPQSPILTRELSLRVLIVGLIILAGAFGLFELELANGASVAQARTVAVNVVVVVEMFYLLNCRSLTQSVFRIGFFSNRWVIIGLAVLIALQVMFTAAPFMNTFLSSAPISMASWGRVVAVGFAGYVVIEIEKWLRRRAESI